MKKDFKKFIGSMRDNIASWDYYVDFKKVYKNVESIKVELNILNSLVGSKNIKEDFYSLYKKYPEILTAIPILLAKRESQIKINDEQNHELIYNFKKRNLPIENYAELMEKSGLFDLISNHIIHNLVDYVTGVEVGMDTNARKNRTGELMENLIDKFLSALGFIKNVSYFRQMTTKEIEKRFHMNLSALTTNNLNVKKFDFVIRTMRGNILAIEVNFYSSGGSKLNETARSYIKLGEEAKKIPNFDFVWITDGVGWQTAEPNLAEAIEKLDFVFNIEDLSNSTFLSLIGKY